MGAKMKIKDLVVETDYRFIAGNTEAEVGKIVWDSRKVNKGDVFVALIGTHTDGHTYIPQVIEAGASAVVIDKAQTVYDDKALSDLVSGKDCAVVEISDTRIGLAQLAMVLYSHPERDIKLFGVTGTKGKTTTSFMLHKMIQDCGHKAGLMGTVFNKIGEKTMKTDHTTPEAPITYEFLDMLRDGGYDSCVMEVSSLGFKYGRNYGMHYKVGIFTNLYKDHVGGVEHPDMEDYYNSKLMIFDNTEIGIINIDSDRSDRTIEYASERCRVFTYGVLNDDADVRADNIRTYIKNGISGTEFDLVYDCYVKEVFVPIPGSFNVYNALCALTTAIALGLDIDKAIESLAGVSVPGRLQPVENKFGAHILIDYAHNGDAMEKVINTIMEFTTGRLITVFGCGGDRPKQRRYDMGRISSTMSDIVVVTSDTPRNEDLESILHDILSTMSDANCKIKVIRDRREAIMYATQLLREGDTMLIAGRGHEDYIEIKGVRHHILDFEVATEAVKAEEIRRGLR